MKIIRKFLFVIFCFLVVLPTKVFLANGFTITATWSESQAASFEEAVTNLSISMGSTTEPGKEIYVKVQTNSTRGYYLFFESENRVGNLSNNYTSKLVCDDFGSDFFMEYTAKLDSKPDRLPFNRKAPAINTENTFCTDRDTNPIDCAIYVPFIDEGELPQGDEYDSYLMNVDVIYNPSLPAGIYRDTILFYARPN